MRDLLFKNLTSEEKRRRIVSTSEISEDQGVRSIVRRHFICILKEVGVEEMVKPEPYLYVLKEHNQKEGRERFFCRIKESKFLVAKGKIFLALYMHSLRIDLSASRLIK